MRVVIAKKLLSTVGGSEAQARALARALVKLRHEVTLVGLRPPWRRRGIPLDVYAAPPGPVELRHERIRYLFIPVRGRRLGAAIDSLFPTTLVRADELAHAVAGADVVHSIAREWAGALERAARAAGAAFVETPLVHPGQLFSGTSDSDIARYRRDDAVIALTNWEADWYGARRIRHVHVTGVGPIIDWLPEVPMDPATVLFVGRKERYKGYHALREAARIVWRSRPEARFVAIGQEAWYARFLPRWKDERWVDRGIVTEAEKAEAYARATIFAMPSVHETFGHAYLEAWYAWRPVIAGDIPALREVVRDGVDGLIVAQDPHAIARAILSLLGDTTRARRMGESGRFRLQEKWTWDLVAERTERAYEAARERAASR
ncbi:MAG TPA: glycosyltransferase family 4 protein [Candidatus Limnocylindria bacterium]|jgi:glycosyltransferase involved in cell wall biosynthesis|nr:glycosyltransferase family 4 protein [Candidatus Limnocylindria bacterium]